MGISRSTRGDLIASLVRQGITVTGSYAFEWHIDRLGTPYANAAARRITVVSRAARLKVLSAVAEVYSVRNLYTQQSAMLVDRAPWAAARTLRRMIGARMRSKYLSPDWVTQMVETETAESLRPRSGDRGVRGEAAEGTWLICVYGGSPVRSDNEGQTPRGIYGTRSELIREAPTLSGRMRSTAGTHGWEDIGIRALEATGWRQDVSRENDQCVDQTPPPPEEVAGTSVVGALSPNEAPINEGQHRLESMGCTLVETLTVEVEPYVVGSTLATTPYLRDPGRGARTQCRFHGSYDGAGLPVYIREGTIAHALE